MKKEYYIFGYGSLVNSLNRYRTIKIKNKHIIPAIINKDFGYIRTSKFPAMGIIKTKNNKKDINGLLLKVNENELKKLDTREKCYYRIRVPNKYISIIDDDNNFDKSLPVYI